MEQENIQYTGITQATSDLNCPDGDLSVSHNIINHNGAMRPIILPEAEFALKSGETLLYVHTTSNYKNFIYQVGDSIKAFKFIDKNRIDYTFSHNINSDEKVIQIQSIGNTIAIITTNSIYYSLFKDNEYIYLGEKAPELQMSFGLIGYRESSEEITVDINQNTIPESDIYPISVSFLSENGAKQVTEQLIPKINEFINKRKSNGQFTGQFFVRYAYRTINGYYMQSAPVLMTPNSGRFPYLPCSYTEYKDNILKKVKVNIEAYACALDYRLNANAIEQLKKWSDIIQSVDIFITEPITMYDQNGTINTYRKGSGSTMEGFYYYRAGGGYICLNHDDNNKIYSYTGDLSTINKFELGAPVISGEDFSTKIKSSSVFRKIKSLSLSELKAADSIRLKGEILQNIQVQEVLPDDYKSHDKIACKSSFIYNSRLNIANVKRYPYAFPLECLSTYTNGEQSSNTYIQKTYNYKLTVFIRESGYIAKIKSEASSLNNLGWWIYYPNPNAYRMIIEKEDAVGKRQYADIQLVKHEYLNGAYYYNTLGMPFSDTVPANEPDSVNCFYEPNKIYTSEVGNPFLFPLEGINTIGVGQILGMSSTTRALSQGQFGQFPLLVFATDGIWAMEVSPNGLYSVKQPISRDICSNPKSITQIDGAVIFISDKGAMIIDADQVNTFSAELDGPTFSPASIIQFDVIAEKEGLTKELNSQVSVKDFLMNCQIAYDYPNSRLLFINANKPYAYVYSLQSHSWATVTSSFTHVVTDYPHTYLQDNNRQIVNISSKIDYESDSRVKSVLLSRPIKLGDDMLKTINQVINRGNFEVDKINVVLFASTDGITYFPIGSATGPRISGLCGSPYRYFRIAVISNFSAKESLSATSVYYTPKWRNKPR